MSGKPEKPQDDLLEKIISDGLNRIDNPGQEQKPAPQEEPSPPPAEEEQKPPEKNKRSSVYIYLLILFGAAFMMLLLAYFVQQRNSETAISDLRNSMNLSRTELMEQIETLKAEKESLEKDMELQEEELTQAQERCEDERTEKLAYIDELTESLFNLSYSTALEFLERFCNERDYLMAAVIVENCDEYFNEKNREYVEAYRRVLPPQSGMYMELREEVFEKTGCMVLSEKEDGNGETTERPHIDAASGRYSGEAMRAARLLWDMIFSYFNRDLYRAGTQANALSADAGDLTALLYDGTFRPSTAALYEQIIKDLEEGGFVEPNEDSPE